MDGVASIEEVFHGGAEAGDAEFGGPAVGVDGILGGALVESFLMAALGQLCCRYVYNRWGVSLERTLISKAEVSLSWPT